MSTYKIIVIGASAGGIKALQTVVAPLPADLNASLFIVEHIPASLPSVLPTILSRACPLPALHPTDGTVIERGKIYVAPPDHHLVLEQGRIHLGTGPKEHYVRPAADVLFRSAAQIYSSQVIGVILTGMDHDGTNGLLAVKQAGGTTVVQDPREALFPSMPQSALQAVEIDYCVSLMSMAPLLIHLVALPF